MHENATARAPRPALRERLGSLFRRPAPPPHNPAHALEARWPVGLAVIATVLLYGSLPNHLTFGPPWLFPLIEVVLLVPLLLTEPHWHAQAGWPWQRLLSLALVGLINASNLVSLALLVNALLHGGKATGAQLIVDAGKIWFTNILVFALWYWQMDRGGPRSRHWREPRPPDFLFPQMISPAVAAPTWMPTFVDYLYLAFTNATAFSPTDALPLTPAAKLLMAAQSLISLLTVALVGARAVNILGS